MEKRILEFNEVQYNQALSYINSKLDGVTEVSEIFNDLNIGRLDGEMWIDILSGGGKIITITEAKIDKQFKKAGITINSIIQEAYSENKKVIENIESKLRILQTVNTLSARPDLLVGLSFDENGMPFITDEQKQSIKDECTLYATKEKSFAALELQKEALQALQKYLNIFKDKNLPIHGIDQFFYINVFNGELSAEIIDFDSIL